MDYIEPCNFYSILTLYINSLCILNKAEEDIRMSKHVLQIKVCCHLP